MSRAAGLTVRLPWLMGLVALLLVSLGLLVQPDRPFPSDGSVDAARARTAGLAAVLAADLSGLSERLAVVAADLPDDAGEAELEAALLVVGAEGLELSPGGPAVGVAVPSVAGSLDAPGVRLLPGSPVVTVAAGGRTLRAVVPAAGLLPPDVTVLGSLGETVLGPVVEEPPAPGSARVEGSQVVAVEPVPTLPGSGPALSVLTTTTVELATPGRAPFVIAGLAVLAVTVGVAAWLWRILVAPVQALARAADRILDGDLESPVPAGRNDEIGRLAAAVERCRVLTVRREVREGRTPTRPD